MRFNLRFFNKITKLRHNLCIMFTRSYSSESLVRWEFFWYKVYQRHRLPSIWRRLSHWQEFFSSEGPASADLPKDEADPPHHKDIDCGSGVRGEERLCVRSFHSIPWFSLFTVDWEQKWSSLSPQSLGSGNFTPSQDSPEL